MLTRWIGDDESYKFDFKDILCIDDAAIFSIARVFYRENVLNLYSLTVFIRYLHCYNLHHFHLWSTSFVYNFHLVTVRDRYSKYVNYNNLDRRFSSTVNYIISSHVVSNISWSDPFYRGLTSKKHLAKKNISFVKAYRI